jgi:cell division septal protein FtsQ
LPSRAETRRRAHRWAIGSLIALVIITLSAPLWSGLVARVWSTQLKAASRHYRVEQIVVRGLRVIPEADALKLSGIETGIALYGVAVEAAKKRLETHPWIKYAYVRRRIPDTIEIRITEREPVAALRGNEMLMITADGVVVAPIGANWVWDLPLLTPPQPIKPKPGTKIADPATLALLRETLTARTVSRDAWENLSELYYLNGEIHATLTKPQADVVIGKGASELAWKAALEYFRNHPQPAASPLQCLDLRIPGRIIVTENTPRAEEPVRG